MALARRYGALDWATCIVIIIINSIANSTHPHYKTLTEAQFADNSLQVRKE